MSAVWHILEIVLVFFAGASIFSFVTVVAHRFPLGEDWVKACSHCLACGHLLAARDLVPVFGWILLKGRCRYCHTRLSPRHPLAEAAGGAMAVFCIHWFGPGRQALVAYAFLSVLALIALTDLDTMQIPNAFVLAAGVVSLAAIPFFPSLHIPDRLLGICVVSVPMILINLLVPGGFGGGDCKLAAVCGLFLGWRIKLWGTAFAIFAAGCYCVVMLAAGKIHRRSRIPFGPFLCLGAAVAVFCL